MSSGVSTTPAAQIYDLYAQIIKATVFTFVHKYFIWLSKLQCSKRYNLTASEKNGLATRDYLQISGKSVPLDASRAQDYVYILSGNSKF